MLGCINDQLDQKSLHLTETILLCVHMTESAYPMPFGEAGTFPRPLQAAKLEP